MARLLIVVGTILISTLMVFNGAFAQPGFGNKIGSIWDRPQVQGAAADNEAVDKSKSEEKLLQEAREKIKGKDSGASGGLSSDIQSDFQNAQVLSVKDYLAKYEGASSENNYRVGGMDIISVRVFDEPELSRDDIRISNDGQVTIPLIGQVNVANKTTREIEKFIEKRFISGGYLKDPHVTVQVREFKSRKVLLMGALNNPGTFSLEGNETLLEMLSKAGGIRFDSHGDVAANIIRILRSTTSQTGKVDRISMSIDLESLTKGVRPEYNLLMHDKDVVYVPEALRFFVAGEVKTPGHYKLRDRPITVVEGITMAGGLTDKASANRTKVVRMENGKEVTISVPIGDILDGDRSKDIVIHANDVIVVPQSLF